MSTPISKPHTPPPCFVSATFILYDCVSISVLQELNFHNRGLGEYEGNRQEEKKKRETK